MSRWLRGWKNPRPEPTWLDLSIMLAALLAMIGWVAAMIVWLFNHHMGEFPTWFIVITTTCEVVFTAGLACLWYRGIQLDSSESDRE